METAREFLDFNNHLNLEIDHFDYGRFPWGLHYHDVIPFHRLFFIPSGSRSRKSYIRSRGLGNEKILLEPGRVYFIPREFDLEYNFRPSLLLLGIHFQMEIFAGLDILENKTAIEILAEDSWGADWLWAEMKKAPSPGRAARIRAIVLASVGAAIDLSQEEIREMRRVRDRYGVLLDWIRDHVRAGLKVADLAAAGGLSESQVSKGFSRDMGLPVKKYVNRELAREAAKRILFSGKKIREIAEDLSFTDEYYFSRFFRRQTGLSPGEYRKRYTVE